MPSFASRSQRHRSTQALNLVHVLSRGSSEKGSQRVTQNIGSPLSLVLAPKWRQVSTLQHIETQGVSYNWELLVNQRLHWQQNSWSGHSESRPFFLIASDSMCVWFGIARLLIWRQFLATFSKIYKQNNMKRPGKASWAPPPGPKCFLWVGKKSPNHSPEKLIIFKRFLRNVFPPTVSLVGSICSRPHS